MCSPFSITPIGTLYSPFKEKFAVPRQPGLAPSALAYLCLQGDANQIDAVRGIEQYSHLWLLFLFDQNLDKGWRPTVRPPRLGGNEKMGVFASRATFRPNGIGMSAVELVDVTQDSGQVTLVLRGCDLVDQTPIVDIKPYIPYSDSIPDAQGGFAHTKPTPLDVHFSDRALLALSPYSEQAYYQSVIAEVLAQDPRPAYRKGKPDNRRYAVHLFDFNVTFHVQNEQIEVASIEAFVETPPRC
ncbi:tRNA (N6-threonylcarbamoyladenosine(37)-N6)-methyltransferase TrmO [Salinivibrio kushneri]|uniref:tRNA (N6-threonylcarbamoyladenosine(37)-N6)-methyltransferase TrmO n=1 Tax=Salinivibrio kushneri TaxID=1908198 RepID=UPI0009887834|nr:tRNA (N6-threonylcarbamoyladenosine(37)-N6)-methyltransferase TrmO [Salinivibrio kushneri]OOE34511.1 tRNA (N6-threonylcarbamoyladenosine(37)-N6)-methyltransferase TrmO [Salinivibrio kushneri]OOE56093.1 tRNA (N6-threonylcarbamoyladenosine(37)-N6)-methyltransferase TrmO [Salinivibrio kushneri]